jgi:glycosyltransferase involved in cell wall biosynthesis
MYEDAGIPHCQQCVELAKKMNQWGAEKCLENIDHIVEEIFPRAKEWVKQNKPWSNKLFPNIVKYAAIRLRIKSDVEKAISSTSKFKVLALEPIEFEGQVKRNLIYHIYPLRNNEMWRWNVSQLLPYLEKFNGRKVIAIVTDDKTDDAKTVKDMFPSGIKFIELHNNRRIGETATFPKLLQSVMNDDPNTITFYAHAKGVSRKGSELPVIKHWTEAMYKSCLDDMDAVETALIDHGVAGGYRRHQKLGKATWYYSGSFYWFRNTHVISRDWQNIELTKRWASESWPGRLFNLDESAVLGVDKVASLYKKQEWDRIKTPATPKQNNLQLTIITPTGDRPEAFALCEKFISRQTYKDKFQWIVVDDGEVATRCTQGQTYIRRQPKRGPVHTLPENLRSAIPSIHGEKILFIEDDEWYHPDYLKSMVEWLDQDALVGVITARYYWPRITYYREFPEHKHASLCRTGIRSSLIPTLIKCCGGRDPSIDIRLWETTKGTRHPSNLVVGMKQMPGRKSGGGDPIKAGKSDADLKVLKSWIGDDWKYYQPILPKQFDPGRAMKEEIVVYTVVIGGYDPIRPPLKINPKIRYAAITDGTAPEPWEVIRPTKSFGSNAANSRYWKINAHKLFPNADWIIYYDGQLQLACDPLLLLAEFEAWGNPTADLFLFNHQNRDCVYAEGKEVLRIKRDRETADKINPQLTRYRSQNFPERAGLYLGGIHGRRGKGRCDEFNKIWWEEVAAGSYRDQISLPIALKRSGINFSALPANWWSHFVLRHQHTHIARHLARHRR